MKNSIPGLILKSLVAFDKEEGLAEGDKGWWDLLTSKEGEKDATYVVQKICQCLSVLTQGGMLALFRRDGDVARLVPFAPTELDKRLLQGLDAAAVSLQIAFLRALESGKEDVGVSMKDRIYFGTNDSDALGFMRNEASVDPKYDEQLDN